MILTYRRPAILDRTGPVYATKCFGNTMPQKNPAERRERPFYTVWKFCHESREFLPVYFVTDYYSNHDCCGIPAITTQDHVSSQQFNVWRQKTAIGLFYQSKKLKPKKNQILQIFFPTFWHNPSVSLQHSWNYAKIQNWCRSVPVRSDALHWSRFCTIAGQSITMGGGVVIKIRCR